ncbi:MAG: S41 family peptidase [Clostridiales bacterium]|jgi:carboxyl-terminal processing protease|nr:S41 family peptidase [Clostridiales bacterium]
MGRKANYFLGLLSGIALMIVAWVAFMSFDGVGTPVRTIAPTAAAASAELDETDIMQKLNHIHQILEANFIGDFDLEIAIEMMFAGFVYGAGDPYTVYMDEATFASFREETEGSFIGIGVSITVDAADNRILIISPFEGSPAFEAGILPGDKIIRINGYEVFGDGINEAIRMMRGEAGTEVVVTIYRQSNGTTFDVPIIRDVIEVETVRSDILAGNIGYIRISQFDRVTYEQFVGAYERLLEQNVQGLILDLRNNPGGLLDVVNNITNMLVPEGIITYTEDARGRRIYVPSDERQIEIPLIVLVNGNSASASEVLSGAVLDTGVGELLGTTTFGKGLVQNIFPLRDGSAVKVTVQRYFTPSGRSIHGEGITPNHYVEMDVELTNNLMRLSPEEDVQLQEAINIMNVMIGQ